MANAHPRSDEANTADSEAAIEEALTAFRDGQPVCIHDADDREGEVDLVYPARAVTPDAVQQLRSDAGGLICVALAPSVADAADLPYLAEAIDHPTVAGTELAYGDRSSFSLTVNHRETFTGITDEDRALTIAEVGKFADEATQANPPGVETFADRFRAPGHVHLLRAADGLLGERHGHTELAVELAQGAGCPPAAVVCEMLGDDGGPMSIAHAREYARDRDIPFLTGQEICSWATNCDGL